MTADPPDPSNGYEAIAKNFISARNPHIGASTIREWSQTLPPGSSILDLGCGHGIPISQTLIEAGFAVYGVDASPTLVQNLRDQFPNATVECSAVEDSNFFHRTFDGIVAVGLIFLLPPDVQSAVIQKAAKSLTSDGKFLFTSPKEVVTWRDSLTGRESVSLGADRYHQILRDAGLVLVGELSDEGVNHYYLASKS